MSITVKKAGEAEKNEMKSKPIWECEVSEFDWHYVVFPKGLSCVWKVSKPVKKHYIFG